MNNSESKSNKLKLLVSLCILIMCVLVGFIIYQADKSFVHNSLAEESNYSTNNASEQIIDLETSTNSVNLIVQNNVIIAFQPLATFSGNLVISAEIIEIGYRAFAGDTSIKSISFESGSQLETIGDYAFANCTNLKSIDMIPKRVTSIGDGAFLSCKSLTRVTFEDNSWLDIVGMGAFSNCVELQSVDFGVNSWLTTIESGVFSDCHSLSNIVIPGSVKKIGDGAFLWCSDLTSITFGADTQLNSIGIGAFSNCSYLTSITIPNGVSEIGYGAFSFCDNLTIYAQPSSRPSTWDINWNSADYTNMERPVLWGCALETDKPYVSSFNKTDSNIYNPESFEIMAPNREDHRFEGWYSNSSFTGISYTASQVSSAPNGIYYAKWFLTTYNIIYRKCIFVVALFFHTVRRTSGKHK